MFVPLMDEDSFPPLDTDGWPVRAVRRLAQVSFGLRPPTV